MSKQEVPSYTRQDNDHSDRVKRLANLASGTGSPGSRKDAGTVPKGILAAQ